MNGVAMVPSGIANEWNSASFSANTSLSGQPASVRLDWAHMRLKYLAVTLGDTTMAVPEDQLRDVERPDLKTLRVTAGTTSNPGDCVVSFEARVLAPALQQPQAFNPMPAVAPGVTTRLPEILSYVFANGRYVRRERRPCIPAALHSWFRPEPGVEYAVTGDRMWPGNPHLVKNGGVESSMRVAAEFVYRTGLSTAYDLPPVGGGEFRGEMKYVQRLDDGPPRNEVFWVPAHTAEGAPRGELYRITIRSRDGSPDLVIEVCLRSPKPPTAKIVVR
jgi:hypothetical protein